MNSGKLIKDFLREDVEDASKLLGLALNKTQEQLFANLDYEINNSEFKKFLSLVEDRKSGKPFAYIKGSQGFYDHDFIVSPSTLIPRPETELLIDIAIDSLDSEKKIKVLDLGTGSGIIAITLSNHRPKWEVSACDQSSEALSVAKLNAKSPIDFYCGSWFEPLPKKKFDFIVSNPPYLPMQEMKNMELQVTDHEPNIALFVPDQYPLIFYSKIAHISKSALKPNGQLFFEIHYYLIQLFDILPF